MTKLTPGAALAAMRRKYKIKCSVCGKAHTARDPRVEYCGNSCRQKAHRERAKAKAAQS